MSAAFVLSACTAPSAESAVMEEPAACSGEPRKVSGVVYCDNRFTLWVNGEEVARDPIAFTPHQAVRVEFDWDGRSDLTYAVQCEDYASESGFEYVETGRAQLGDGALIADFDDGFGTVTSDGWQTYTVTFGPTDASLGAGCGPDNLEPCVVEDRGVPDGWTSPEFDDTGWTPASEYTAREAGWGRPPSWSESEGCCGLTSPMDRSDLGCDASVSQQQCLNPKSEFSATGASFIWAADLERDNQVLFRHTARCSP